jgi:archaellum biogenesis ATPase FlaH
MDESLTDKFISGKPHADLESILRKNYEQDPVQFGIKFLDQALDGIFPNDLVLISSATGVGKTELATSIALHNCKKGKNVHYFALEAEGGEIIRRVKFKKLSEAFYMQREWSKEPQRPNFGKWLRGKQKNILEKFEPEVEEIIIRDTETLHVRYRKQDFTVKDFQIEAQMIQDKTDLIIVDHFHYLDPQTESEKDHFEKAMKFIRDTCLLTGKPIILLAHIRKQDRRFKSLVPSIEDIHGTSNISKICTKAFTFSPAFEDGPPINNGLYPTYFKIQKSRTGGDRNRLIAKLTFNSNQNKYLESYQLGYSNFEGDTFTELEPLKYPDWAEAPSIFSNQTWNSNEV